MRASCVLQLRDLVNSAVNPTGRCGFKRKLHTLNERRF